jgi:hypothetical protein
MKAMKELVEDESVRRKQRKLWKFLHNFSKACKKEKIDLWFFKDLTMFQDSSFHKANYSANLSYKVCVGSRCVTHWLLEGLRVWSIYTNYRALWRISTRIHHQILAGPDFSFQSTASLSTSRSNTTVHICVEDWRGFRRSFQILLLQ